MNWVIPIIIFFDQLTKKLSETFLLEKNIKIGFFQLTYIENTGIAFGFFKDLALLHGTLSTLIVIFLFILKEKYKERYKLFTVSFDLGISFIIGGALGNIFDRIRLGYVVDMIYWPNFSIFNVADIFVTFGGVILLYHFFKRGKYGEKNIQG